MGLSWWLTSKESICNAGDTDDAVWSLGGEDPLEEEMETHSGFSPRGHKELDTTDHKYTGAWLAYSAVLVSGLQQSDSVLHIHTFILFQILFSYRLP